VIDLRDYGVVCDGVTDDAPQSKRYGTQSAISEVITSNSRNRFAGGAKATTKRRLDRNTVDGEGWK